MKLHPHPAHFRTDSKLSGEEPSSSSSSINDQTDTKSEAREKSSSSFLHSTLVDESKYSGGRMEIRDIKLGAGGISNVSVDVNSSPRKRPAGNDDEGAGDDLENEQPLSKRFNMLGLSNVQNLLYHPAISTSLTRARSNAFSCISTSTASTSTSTTSHINLSTSSSINPSINNHSISASSNPSSNPPCPFSTTSSSSSNSNTAMKLDDTRDRIYIRNLDDEISNDGNDSMATERLHFLPDLEKRIMGASAIPQSVLTGRSLQQQQRYHNEVERGFINGGSESTTAAATAGGELVLYRVPEAISILQTEDNVRKAMIEARERARKRAWEDVAMDGLGEYSAVGEGGLHLWGGVPKVDSFDAFGSGGHDRQVGTVEGDGDAMEIEDL